MAGGNERVGLASADQVGAYDDAGVFLTAAFFGGFRAHINGVGSVDDGNILRHVRAAERPELPAQHSFVPHQDHLYIQVLGGFQSTQHVGLCAVVSA